MASPPSRTSTVGPRPKAYSYVRISTDAQVRGDGQRRQVEQSKKYASEHGLDLDLEFTLHDLGVSAFRGNHVSNGRLGVFLAAVESKKIQPGSYLIIESLDRLSRQEVQAGQSLFLEIVKAGINIVTLADGHVYRAGNITFPDLMYSLTALERAHDESQTKSYRLKRTWEKKRAEIGDKRLTIWGPAWLEASQPGGFKVLKDRADVVRRIFNECADGLGIYSIVRRLNQEGVTPFVRKTKLGKELGAQTWHSSYVAKILDNRAVFGEFQPHRRDEHGRRVPAGPPQPNYFPKIVDEELFYRAKNSRASRDLRHSTAGRGRKGTLINNLFAGVAKCAYCDGTMYFEDKGLGPKGGTFLVCDGMRRGLGCDSSRWRYDEFEASFLRFVEELNLQDLAISNDDVERQQTILLEIEALNGRKRDLENQIGRLTEAIATANVSRDALMQTLEEKSSERLRIEADFSAKTTNLASLSGTFKEFYESTIQIHAVLKRFQTASGTNSDLFRLRSQVAHRIRGLVDTVFVAADGSAPFLRGALEKKLRRLRSVRKRQELFAELSKPATVMRYFTVRFRDGSIRIIVPKGDPLDLEVHIAGPHADLLVKQDASGSKQLGPSMPLEDLDGWIETNFVGEDTPNND